MASRVWRSRASRTLRFEQLEQRQLFAAAPWQNPGQALDVNGDLVVDRRDVDAITAALKQKKVLGPRSAGTSEPYFDVSGDGKLNTTDRNLVAQAISARLPLVTAAAISSSGQAASPGAAAVKGRVQNWTNKEQLFARVNGGPWLDVTSRVASSQFTLSVDTLAALTGGAGTTGSSVLELQARRAGKVRGKGLDLPLPAIQSPAPPSNEPGHSSPGNAPPTNVPPTNVPPVVPPPAPPQAPPAEPGVVANPSWTADRPPGVVIDWQPAASKQFVGSPSIAILPSGEYVASHDLFGAGSTRDTTEVFVSADRGKTWQQRATIRGQYWSTLFVHGGALYLLGNDREMGNVVIRRSLDGGRTWTTPGDNRTGKLLTGSFASGAMPVMVHNGRIWRSMEAVQGKTWGMNFSPFVISARADADLLNAANWTPSNQIAPQASWLGSRFGGFLEGSVVVDRNGEVVNMLRVHTPDFPEQAAMLHISADGKRATFDPKTDFIAFPGGAKKFTIRFDAASGRYWSLSNDVPARYRGLALINHSRNTLSLVSSSDLRTWRVERVLVEHSDVVHSGFQYADWQFDGEDLIVALRTAYQEPSGGLAGKAHDANYLTFLRVKGFRSG